MQLGAPLIPAEAVEPVWFGLVDHAEDLAIEENGTVWCGGEEGQIYRGRSVLSLGPDGAVSGRRMLVEMPGTFRTGSFTTNRDGC